MLKIPFFVLHGYINKHSGTAIIISLEKNNGEVIPLKEFFFLYGANDLETVINILDHIETASITQERKEPIKRYFHDAKLLTPNCTPYIDIIENNVIITLSSFREAFDKSCGYLTEMEGTHQYEIIFSAAFEDIRKNKKMGELIQFAEVTCSVEEFLGSSFLNLRINDFFELLECEEI